MVCKKCGADLPESAVFCPECGSWIVEKAPAKPAAKAMTAEEILEEPEIPPKESKVGLFFKNKKKRDLLLSIVAVVIAALSLTASFILDNPHLSPSNVVMSYLDASYRKDQQQFVELLPPQLLEYMGGVEQSQNVIQSTMDNFWGRLEEGYQARILSQDEVTDSTLDSLLAFYQNNVQLSVSQVRKVRVETTYSLYGEPISVENELVVIQLDGSWYFDLYSNSSATIVKASTSGDTAVEQYVYSEVEASETSSQEG